MLVETYNPFRYRGYFYDWEIECNYLQSRYYYPQWGRFLNSDNISKIDSKKYNLFQATVIWRGGISYGMDRIQSRNANRNVVEKNVLWQMRHEIEDQKKHKAHKKGRQGFFKHAWKYDIYRNESV
ncbi:MAG: hypothetical protein E7620_00345 [Ruminococcaceae bacterium]|nr:hypothetical protein [Oscillospiraceae bacterium]